jgi:alpha-glucosidase (family GH31 glycosyl hydrolase)
VWFSRWWPWADWEAASLLREFDERGVPCDVLITDMDWHHTCYRRTYGNASEKSMDASHNWPCWSGFSFDRKYFAEPAAFLNWCKATGVHNGLNLHFQSGLVRAEEDADRWGAFASAMALPPSAEYVRECHATHRHVLVSHLVPSHRTPSHRTPSHPIASHLRYARFDPLNATYSSHFHTHVLAPLERLGVDFWWLDWQQGEAEFAATDTPEANPTWWLNYVYGTQPDGRRADAGAATQRRRLIMHRWGGMGNQRYPIGFSGDVTSSWASLAFQPAFTAAAANVNFGYWSRAC